MIEIATKEVSRGPMDLLMLIWASHRDKARKRESENRKLIDRCMSLTWQIIEIFALFKEPVEILGL